MAEATATSEQSTYDVKIEDVGAAKKRLTITVPAEVIDRKIEESLGTLATQAALPGFRKGRAPKALLERRFGPSVRNETRSQVIADGYASAIEEHKIKPVGEPDPVEPLDELEIEPGRPLTFSVDVEVVPEFEVPALEGMEILKPIVEITDEHIDVEMRAQCTRLGEIEPVETDFQEGDRLLGPGSATIAGEEEPFFRHDNIDIIVPGEASEGRGHVLGLLVDGLGELLAGKKAGDTITITTTGPESHEREEIRGKDLEITMTIRDGQHIRPASVEQVLERYGIGSEDLLREQIRLALEQRRDEEQRAAMRDQVYARLVELIDFELPEKLSRAQVGRMLERQRLEMLYRGGLSVDEVETRLAEMRAETELQSRRRLKLSFILHRLAEQFEVAVSDQEINGRIAAIAVQRGVRPDKLRSELIQSGGLGTIATQIREHKTADRVIDHATVREVTAEEWRKAAAERHEAAAKTTAKPAAKPAAKKTTTKKKTTKKKTTGRS